MTDPVHGKMFFFHKINFFCRSDIMLRKEKIKLKVTSVSGSKVKTDLLQCT